MVAPPLPANNNNNNWKLVVHKTFCVKPRRYPPSPRLDFISFAMRRLWLCVIETESKQHYSLAKHLCNNEGTTSLGLVSGSSFFCEHTHAPIESTPRNIAMNYCLILPAPVPTRALLVNNLIFLKKGYNNFNYCLPQFSLTCILF